MSDIYERAIIDESERKKLLSLKKTKSVADITSGVLLSASFVELVVFYCVGKTGGYPPVPLFYVTVALALVSAAVGFVAEAVFNSKFNNVLRRKPDESESEELALYRSILLDEREKEAAALKKNAYYAFAGVALFLLFIIADMDFSSLKLDFGDLSFFGFVFLIIGITIALRKQSISRQNKNNLSALKKAELCEKIDAQQGVKRKISMQSGKDGMFYYLFPDPEIRIKAQVCRKKLESRLLFAFVAGSLSGAIIAFLNSYVYGVDLEGWAYPMFISIVFGFTLMMTFVPARRFAAIKKEQLTSIEGQETYSNVVLLHKAYKDYSAGKGKTLLYAVSLSLISAWALGIAFHDIPWSLISIVIIFIGIILQNKFYNDFRQSVLPLEREIENVYAEKRLNKEGFADKEGFWFGAKNLLDDFIEKDIDKNCGENKDRSA